MPAVEIFVRVRVEEGASTVRIQQSLSGIHGYIGSYIVDIEKVGDGAVDPFDIAIGYNVPEERIADTMNAVRGTEGVVGARGIKNRNPVTPLILFPIGGSGEQS
jgi:hypothetical protein